MRDRRPSIGPFIAATIFTLAAYAALFRCIVEFVAGLWG